MALQFGKVADVLPAPSTDTTNQFLRLSEFGATIMEPRGLPSMGHAQEGLYFRATIPIATSAIALTGVAQTTWVATTPTMTIRNSGAAGQRSIYMDFIQVNILTQGGATGTMVQGGLVTDVITRYSSGGTAMTNITNANVGSSTTSNAIVHGGAITAAAASTDVRYMSRFGLKNAREAVGDQYTIKFGAQHAYAPLVGAVPVGPVIIAPETTHTLLFYMWIPGLSTTAPTGDIVVGWWER